MGGKRASGTDKEDEMVRRKRRKNGSHFNIYIIIYYFILQLINLH